MNRVSNLKTLSIGALVAVLGVGMFFYANRTTVAARVGAKRVASENALHHVPAVTGVDSSAALYW
jgi:hypothetical protein